MTVQITAERALELLTRVVKREGRDTLRECRYVEFDNDGDPIPHCIVACMLVEAGVPMEEVSRFPNRTIGGLNSFRELAGVVDLSAEALHIIQDAQDIQDGQYSPAGQAGSWGKALAAARRHAWRHGVIGKRHDTPSRLV